MKLFVDTGNVKDIEALAAIGILDGVTTNPSLLAREAADPRTILKRIWVGTEHAAFFVHGQPSREAAELSLKMEAVKLGADGVLNIFCGDQGSYLSNNASYFCHANAIKFN